QTFVARLRMLHEARGFPLKKVPVVGHKELDLYNLFMSVQRKGGIRSVQDRKLFREIGKELNLPASVTNMGYQLRSKYEQILLPFLNELTAEFCKDSTALPPDSTPALMRVVVPSAHTTTPAVPSSAEPLWTDTTDRQAPKTSYKPRETPQKERERERERETPVKKTKTTRRRTGLAALSAPVSPSSSITINGVALVPVTELDQLRQSVLSVLNSQARQIQALQREVASLKADRHSGYTPVITASPAELQTQTEIAGEGETPVIVGPLGVKRGREREGEGEIDGEAPVQREREREQVYETTVGTVGTVGSLPPPPEGVLSPVAAPDASLPLAAIPMTSNTIPMISDMPSVGVAPPTIHP
ncbi:hypothetical protein KIPB_006934, partial [Kipferlia bialata]